MGVVFSCLVLLKELVGPDQCCHLVTFLSSHHSIGAGCVCVEGYRKRGAGLSVEYLGATLLPFVPVRALCQ